jgi:PAS domain S-box-containing protein
LRHRPEGQVHFWCTYAIDFNLFFNISQERTPFIPRLKDVGFLAQNCKTGFNHKDTKNRKKFFVSLCLFVFVVKISFRMDKKMRDEEKSREQLIDELAAMRRRMTDTERQSAIFKERADLLELAHDAIIVRNTDGIILLWSRGAEKFYGWGKEEALGSDYYSFLETRFTEPMADVEARLFRDDYWEGELINTRSDGRQITVSSRWVLQRDERGAPSVILEISNDFTGRKRAEDSLRKSEERYRSFAVASRVFTEASLDLQSIVNTAARSIGELVGDTCIIGLLSDDKQWLNIGGFYHPDPEGLALIRELLEEKIHRVDEGIIGRVLFSGEPLVITKLARNEAHSVISQRYHSYLKKFDVHSLMSVPLRARGRIIGALTVTRLGPDNSYTREDQTFLQDLADLAALAVDNTRLYRQSQEVNRLKDEFLATVSHELRTPLTAILGWSRLLRAGKLSAPDFLHAVDIVERNAKTQAQLIDDLLDISRITTGKLQLDIRPVDLVPVIEAATDAVRPLAIAKEIQINILLQLGLSLVLGDPARLQQVVWNLLSNSIKFTPNGGRIEIRLERVNSHVEIKVSDNGQGISQEFLPFLFDRFRQADSTESREHGGLGLGLAIAHHIVEMHGGRIKAESAGKGQGSAFTVRLPLANTSSEPAHSQIVSPAFRGGIPFDSPPELKGMRVLVVEDEPDTLELIALVLRSCGVLVVPTAAAKDALEQLDREQFDLLVADIGLPGEDGYELIRKIRERAPNNGGKIPAVALTAYARAEDRVRALRAGYQMHVPKPVEPAEIVTVVSRLAGWSKAGK